MEFSPQFVISGDVKEAGLEAEAEVFDQCVAQVGLALRLLEELESAHLRAALCAGADLLRTTQLELPIARIAVGARDEERTDQRRHLGANRSFGGRRRNSRQRSLAQRGDSRRRFEIGLAAVAPRYYRAGYHIAEACAPGLPPDRVDEAVKDTVRRVQAQCRHTSEERAAREAERRLRGVDADIRSAAAVTDDAVAGL